jgi:hypothetical protein
MVEVAIAIDVVEAEASSPAFSMSWMMSGASTSTSPARISRRAKR